MKIFCYSYDSLKNPFLGGGGIYREVNIHRELAQKHDITFFHGYFKKAKSYSENNIIFKYLGFGKSFLLSRFTFFLFATIHSLFHKADLYVISYSVYSPVLTFLFKPKKTIIQLYHFVGKNAFRKYKIFGIIPFMAEKLVLHFAKYFITMAKGASDFIKSKYKKIAIPTYTGIDPILFNKTSKEKNYLLSFGRIDVYMKGLDVLIEVYNALREKGIKIDLKIAGRGLPKDVEKVKAMIKKSKYKKDILFIENPTSQQKLKLFKFTNLVIIPSRFEGWNIVALEAAANSKVVVGSNIAGLSEAVKNNKTGVLCPSENIQCFVNKIILLLSEKEKRKKLAQNAYKYAQGFTWAKMANLQEKFYKHILNL